MAVAEQVELTTAEEQVVGVNLARANFVAGDREVVKGDRLVAEDRRFDLCQAAGKLVATG